MHLTRLIYLRKLLAKKRKLYIRYYLLGYGFVGLTKCINVQTKKNQTSPLCFLMFFSTTPQTLKAVLCKNLFNLLCQHFWFNQQYFRLKMSRNANDEKYFIVL